MNEEIAQSKLSTQWMQASRKRLILAIFLDLIIFNVFWAFIQLGLLILYPELNKLNLPLRLGFFIMLELILYKLIKWSPGYYLLSVKYIDSRSFYSRDDIKPGRLIPIVNAFIKENESWLTMLIGTLFLHNGLKSLVRWTIWIPPIPMFGFETNSILSAIFLVSIGLIECYIGLAILRLQKSAFFVGIFYIGISMISTFLSWHLWGSWVEAMTYQRRAYMGMSVRPGEVEFMRKIIPEGIILLLLIYLVSIIVIRKRLYASRIQR